MKYLQIRYKSANPEKEINNFANQKPIIKEVRSPQKQQT